MSKRELQELVARVVLASGEPPHAGCFIRSDFFEAWRTGAPICRRRSSHKVTQSKRQRLYERDGNACVYCGTYDRLTLDHVVPFIFGGSNHADNLRTACLSCNCSRFQREFGELWGARHMHLARNCGGN